MGMVRVSWSARCFRPRSWRAVPSSVQAVPGAGGGGGQDDPPPPRPRQVQVGLAEHDRLRRAQRRVVQAGEERFQVRAPRPQPPDGGQERPGLGGADDDPPVDARGDGGGGPLDPVDRVGAEATEFDGVAERVVEHRPLAPLGRPGRRLPGQGRGAGGQRQPHVRGVFEVGDREGGALGPVEGGGDCGRRGGVAGGGVERPGEQRLPQHLRVRGARLLMRVIGSPYGRLGAW